MDPDALEDALQELAASSRWSGVVQVPSNLRLHMRTRQRRRVGSTLMNSTWCAPLSQEVLLHGVGAAEGGSEGPPSNRARGGLGMPPPVPWAAASQTVPSAAAVAAACSSTRASSAGDTPGNSGKLRTSFLQVGSGGAGAFGSVYDVVHPSSASLTQREAASRPVINSATLAQLGISSTDLLCSRMSTAQRGSGLPSLPPSSAPDQQDAEARDRSDKLRQLHLQVELGTGSGSSAKATALQLPGSPQLQQHAQQAQQGALSMQQHAQHHHQRMEYLGAADLMGCVQGGGANPNSVVIVESFSDLPIPTSPAQSSTGQPIASGAGGSQQQQIPAVPPGRWVWGHTHAACLHSCAGAHVLCSCASCFLRLSYNRALIYVIYSQFTHKHTHSHAHTHTHTHVRAHTHTHTHCHRCHVLAVHLQA